MKIGLVRREEVLPSGTVPEGSLVEGVLGARVRLRSLVGLGREYLARRPGVHYEAEEVLVHGGEVEEVLEEYEEWWCEVLGPAGLVVGAHPDDGASYGVWRAEP